MLVSFDGIHSSLDHMLLDKYLIDISVRKKGSLVGVLTRVCVF